MKGFGKKANKLRVMRKNRMSQNHYKNIKIKRSPLV